MTTTDNRKTVYLHIGFFKTGSTAIQNFLTGHRALLLEQGYFYPDLGSHDHFCIPAKMAKEAGSPVPPDTLVSKCTRSSEELWEHVLTEFESSSVANLVLSAETFSDFSFSDTSSELVQAVGSRLSRYNVKVILYLREHIPYIRSLYQEVIKVHGAYLSEAAFILNHVEGWHMNFAWTLKYWSEVFGEENMIVDRYLGKEYGGHGLFEDFLGKIGLQWSDELRIPPRGKSNVGISREWVESKRIFNMLENAGAPLHVFVESMSNPERLSEESVEYINNKIASDVELINRDSSIRSPLGVSRLSAAEIDCSNLNYDRIYTQSVLLLLGRLLRSSR